jgi:hypothetical protein
MSHINRTVLLIQIGDLTNIDKIMNIVSQYNVSTNLIVFSLLEKIEINFSHYNLHNYHVMHHQNRGMDIGPYLLQIKWLLNNHSITSFDNVFKLHTKTDQKWFDELVLPLDELVSQSMTEKIYMSDKWALKLDNLNIHHINLICDKYNFNNIYYDIIDDYEPHIDNVDEKFYSTYYDIPIHNCDVINEIMNLNLTKKYILDHSYYNSYSINEKYISLKRRKNIVYSAGSIFIIQYKLLYEQFSCINIDQLYNDLEIGNIKNDKSTFTHALERIISSFFL